MGGGGGQEVKNTGEYPAEFKPLASGAAKQIQAMQNALPLAGFAVERPGQTAGIAPFQQAAMNMMPGLLTPSWGLQTLQQSGPSANQLASNAISVGNQTSPFTNAMAALQSGGLGSGRESFPGLLPTTPASPMQNPNIQSAAPQPNVMGYDANLAPTLQSQLERPIQPSTPVDSALGNGFSAATAPAAGGKSPGSAPMPGATPGSPSPTASPYDLSTAAVQARLAATAPAPTGPPPAPTPQNQPLMMWQGRGPSAPSTQPGPMPLWPGHRP